ncbi:MAG: hypothetical protein FJX45_14385 [Alphaproteobacteria bacterium]|nr:hypothetical protein [Alphaproteobacteria bacterium]MBM3654259.1 hypothetical protein [Alphaproteobacteria bacterium]
MRIARLFAAGTLALLVGACASTAEQRAMDEGRCRGYGFRKGTDGFSKCLLDVDLNRDADRRASLNSPYGWGPGMYGGRPWRYW